MSLENEKSTLDIEQLSLPELAQNLESFFLVPPEPDEPKIASFLGIQEEDIEEWRYLLPDIAKLNPDAMKRSLAKIDAEKNSYRSAFFLMLMIKACPEDRIDIWPALLKKAHNILLNDSKMAQAQYELNEQNEILQRYKDKKDSTTDINPEYQQIIKEAEEIIKENNKFIYRFQLVEFYLLEKSFVASFKYDHDYSQARAILKRQETLKESLGDNIPHALKDPFLFHSLLVSKEFHYKDKIKLSNQFLQNLSTLPILHHNKVAFLAMLISSLEPKLAHFLSSKILEAYRKFQKQEEESSSDPIVNFFYSIREEKRQKNQEKYYKRIWAAWLESHPDKESEEYKEEKKELQNSIDSFEDAFLFASVLKVEGCELHIKNRVDEAIKMYRDCGMNFPEAETQIEMILEFFDELSQKDKKNLFLQSWRIIEKALGTRIWGQLSSLQSQEEVDIVAESFTSQIKSLIEDSIVSSREILRDNEFSPFSNLSRYINNLFKAMMLLFGGEGDRLEVLFKRADREYNLLYDSNRIVKLEEAKQRLKNPENHLELSQKIKKIFDINNISIVSLGDSTISNDFHQIAEKVVSENEMHSESDVIESSPTYGIWKEVTFIPIKNKEEVLILKTQRKLFTEEKLIIQAAINQEDLDISVFALRHLQEETVNDSDLSETQREENEELYVTGTGRRPVGYKRPNPRKFWRRIIDKDTETLMTAVSVSPLTDFSIAFVYAGIPKEQAQSYLANTFGIDIEECSYAGDLSINNAKRKTLFPKISHACGKLSLELGKKYVVMSAHLSVIQSLQRVIGRENLRIISGEVLSLDQKLKILIQDHGWKESFAKESLDLYTHQNSAIILVEAEKLSEVI